MWAAGDLHNGRGAVEALLDRLSSHGLLLQRIETHVAERERCWDVRCGERCLVMEMVVGDWNGRSLMPIGAGHVCCLVQGCLSQRHQRLVVDGCWFALLAHGGYGLCERDWKVGWPRVGSLDLADVSR